jgi:hypothetical protein
VPAGVRCRLVSAAPRATLLRRSRKPGVPSLHGAIAKLDDSEALAGEQSGLFVVRDDKELTLVVEG